MSRKRQRAANRTPGLRVTRKPGERVRLRIGEIVIWIDIAEVVGSNVMLAIGAPQTVEIWREELLTSCPE